MHLPGPIRYALLANIEVVGSRDGPIPLFWHGFSDLNTTHRDREHKFTNTSHRAMVFHNEWTADFFRKHFVNSSRADDTVYVTSVRLNAV